MSTNPTPAPSTTAALTISDPATALAIATLNFGTGVCNLLMTPKGQVLLDLEITAAEKFEAGVESAAGKIAAAVHSGITKIFHPGGKP